MNRRIQRTLLTLAMLPLAAAATWWALGVALPQPAASSAPEARPDQVAEGVARLATRLRQGSPAQSASVADWELLARSQAALEAFGPAAEAYAMALQLEPRSVQLRADRADVLVASGGAPALAEADKMLREALALDPLHPKALAVAGTVAYERKAYGDAAAYWTQAKAVAPSGSEFSRDLDRSIASAREQVAAAPRTATR